MKILSRRAEMRKMRQSTAPVRAPSAEEGRPGGSWRESIVFQLVNIVKGCLTKYLCVLSKCNCELVLSQVWASVKTQLRSIATDLPSGEGGLWALGLPGKMFSKGGDLGQVLSIMDEKNPEKQKQKPLQLSRIHIYWMLEVSWTFALSCHVKIMAGL